MTVAASLLVAAAAWAAAGAMSVEVRSGHLRARPSFLGRVTAEVSYAERVQVLQEQGPWVRVQAAAGSGWIHASALTEKHLVLSAGEEDLRAGASGDELALAGKGFNEEVEGAFRKEHPEVDYAPVERLERRLVSAAEAVAFLRAGGLVARDEGGR
jgi:hypothetical protein